MIAVGQLGTAIPTNRFTRAGFVGSFPIPVWQLVLGWVLLIPLLYIAANGTFILHAGNVDTAATGQAPGTDAAHKVSVTVFSLICIVLIYFRSSLVVNQARQAKLILAFPVLAILSSVWSADPRQSVVSGVILFMFTLFGVYVAGRFPLERQFELIMLVMAIALPASIALALFVPSIGQSDAGWIGIFGHKQMCAGVSVFFLITALHWQCSGIYQRIFRLSAILMCFALIILSKSRTGWALALAALLLCGVIWLLQTMPVKQALAIVLLGLPLAAGALYALHAISPSLLASVGKDSTLSQRTIIWSASWNAAMRHPMLGYGFSSFWKGLYGPSQSVVLIAGWGLQQAQSGFLDVLLGMGAVGIAFIALLTAQAIRNSMRSFYAAQHQAYVRWCLVIILCTLLYNIGESSIGLINMNWFLFLLASIGLSQVASMANETSRYIPRAQHVERAIYE